LIFNVNYTLTSPVVLGVANMGIASNVAYIYPWNHLHFGPSAFSFWQQMTQSLVSELSSVWYTPTFIPRVRYAPGTVPRMYPYYGDNTLLSFWVDSPEDVAPYVLDGNAEDYIGPLEAPTYVDSGPAMSKGVTGVPITLVNSSASAASSNTNA